MELSPSPDQLFGKVGFFVPKMSGNSMRPLIWSGAHRVAVVPLDNAPVLGDILMFAQHLPGGKSRNVIHRLVEIRDTPDGPLYITRGDNCLRSETIRPDDIIGRVAEIHRISGFRPWFAVGARKFSTSDPACRLYSRFWMASWPLRRFCFRVRGRLARLFR
ncbi:MAG: hypothetical protein HDS25_07500 [Bacteroides sp.]|nr:hypothetical protein [Bacteroides sp.]